MNYDPNPARTCTRLMNSIFRRQTKRARERTPKGTRSSIINGCKRLLELAESLQDGTYDLKVDNQQAADFHLEHCAALICNLLLQYTSAGMAIKAIDLLPATTRTQTWAYHCGQISMSCSGIRRLAQTQAWHPNAVRYVPSRRRSLARRTRQKCSTDTD